MALGPHWQHCRSATSARHPPRSPIHPQRSNPPATSLPPQSPHPPHTGPTWQRAGTSPLAEPSPGQREPTHIGSGVPPPPLAWPPSPQGLSRGSLPPKKNRGSSVCAGHTHALGAPRVSGLRVIRPRRARSTVVWSRFPNSWAHPSAQGTLVTRTTKITTQLLREREHEILLGGLHLRDVPIPGPGERLQQLANQFLWHGCSAGHTDRGNTVEPLLSHLARIVHPVRGLCTILECHLHQSDTVRTVGRSHNDDHISLSGNLLNCHLPILSRVANIIRRRILQFRKPLPQAAHRFHRLVNRECCLR